MPVNRQTNGAPPAPGEPGLGGGGESCKERKDEETRLPGSVCFKTIDGSESPVTCLLVLMQQQPTGIGPPMAEGLRASPNYDLSNPFKAKRGATAASSEIRDSEIRDSEIRDARKDSRLTPRVPVAAERMKGIEE
ncbi:hypothetical protein EYF80_041963 [Liparis tanakae]|uniref:Uncharacterized protein n=1 Tax=Liparis tanakae TaxID=230148 RepID=A0A4Z2G3R8_9TELE|nr:hypothetical protein EYF80_041963 [Liparis tanakae]